MGKETSLDPQTQEAIDAALENNWPKAISLNQELLEKYPDDIDATNRLARAFSESGKVGQAKKLYQKVLKLDPYNPIAEKNLKRLSSLKISSDKNNEKTASQIKGDIFLEEPGKTVVAVLTDTAMPPVVAELQTGDKVELTQNRNYITVVSGAGRRIGRIENSLAKNLAWCIKSGSKFDAFIKSVYPKSTGNKRNLEVSVFIRETYRSPKISQSPFPTTPSDFRPYVHEDTLKLLSSNQAPLPTEADDTIEEVDVSELKEIEGGEESLEELAEKEAEEPDELEE